MIWTSEELGESGKPYSMASPDGTHEDSDEVDSNHKVAGFQITNFSAFGRHKTNFIKTLGESKMESSVAVGPSALSTYRYDQNVW